MLFRSLTTFEIVGSAVPALSLVGTAEARIGAPWTPRSAAGVARRNTTWRGLRHTTAWVAVGILDLVGRQALSRVGGRPRQRAVESLGGELGRSRGRRRR
ncbi:hypothetical protein EN807_34410, partial [Mesorhizobium sp. M5C.F.Ca.ET.164.01.1.1]